MPRKKAKPMPAELWVARENPPGWIEFLTWDVDPAMPKGETATRYVRADIAGDLVKALRDLVGYSVEYLPTKPYNMENATNRILGAALAAIAKAEGR